MRCIKAASCTQEDYIAKCQNFLIDGSCHDAWNEDVITPDNPVWETVVMDGIEYLNDAKQLCLRKR